MKNKSAENFDRNEIYKRLETHYKKKYDAISVDIIRKDLKDDVNYYKLIEFLNVQDEELIDCLVYTYGKELFTKAFTNNIKKYLKSE